MQKDYYVILGVSRGADIQKIKKAYRKIVKQYHPDRAASEQHTEKFLEITRAYETLSDPEKRQQYDRELEQRKTSAEILHHAPPQPAWQAEALIGRYQSFLDEFFEGFVPGLFPDFFEKGRGRGKNLYVDLILSQQEARDGGLFPLTVPVREPCPQCSAAGIWEDFFCPVCRGSGRIRGQRTFSLSIPPQVRHGTELQISLEDIGLRGVWLFATVLIDPSLDRFSE